MERTNNRSITSKESRCPGKYRIDVRPGGLVSTGTYLPSPSCVFIPSNLQSLHLLTWSLARMRLHAHRRTGARFYLRSIVCREPKWSPPRQYIHIYAVYMYRQRDVTNGIMFVAKSNSPDPSPSEKEGQGHTIARRNSSESNSFRLVRWEI